MTTVSMTQLTHELAELDRAFKSAEPYFRKHLRPYLMGMARVCNADVLNGSGTHEHRDRMTGRGQACEEFANALYTSYEASKKRLEAEIAAEQAKIDAEDRAHDKANGESDRSGEDNAGDDEDNPFT